MSFGWNDVGRLLADIAPTIAGGLVSIAPGGGFLSPVVAMGVRELEKALGIGSAAGQGQATPEQVAEALSAGSPDTLLKLREADNAYKAKCLEAGVDLEKIAAADRDSARQREMSVKDITPRILAFGIFGGFIGAAAALFFGLVTDIKDVTVATLIGSVFGQLGSKCDLVAAYYFGSSSGSKDKTDALVGLAKGK